VVVDVGETLCVPPLVALRPSHPPVASHEVALVLDQVRLEPAPKAIVAGLAVKVTVGTVLPVTVTIALALAEPPAPVQVSV